MITLSDAVDAMDERKVAVYGDGDGLVYEGQQRRLMVGLDLDFDELHNIASLGASIWLTGLLTGACDIGEALRGLWADGVMTGLLLAEMRKKETAAA